MLKCIHYLLVRRRPAPPTWPDMIADLTKAEQEAEARRDMKAVGKIVALKKARLRAALEGAVAG